MTAIKILGPCSELVNAWRVLKEPICVLPLNAKERVGLVPLAPCTLAIADQALGC